MPTTKPTATSSGVTPTAFSIDRIVTSGNLLVIDGSGLQGFNEVAITDSSNSFEKKFKVTEVTSTRIVSENLSNFSLPVNELLELVLSSASGQTAETVIPITFSLQPNSVSTANIQPQAITATKFKGVAGNPPAGTVPEWDGISQFNFVYPSGGGGGGGGGTVTSVGRGIGIVGSGIPITSAGTISVDIGTRGDPTLTKIPFFNHDDRLVISNPAELYFSDSAFPDNNFVIYNNQFFSIGRVASGTNAPTDYLNIDETGTVSIPLDLEVGATNDWGALRVGGSTVCLNNGQNCGASGNVFGPASSTMNEVAIFSGASGKNITGGGKLIGDLVTGPATAVAGNLPQLDATGKVISDSLIAATNVPQMVADAVTADRPILSAGNSKNLISAGYTIPTLICPNGQILKSDGINFVCLADLVGTGDVVGPSSPTAGNLSSFNSTAGTSIADSGINSLNVVTMLTATPVFNELIVSAGANKSVQSAGILSTDLVTMAASASPTDLVLVSAGNKAAKASTVSINNVVTMSTPTTNAAEILISDAMFSRTAIGSGLAIANVPTMATNSTGANSPILAVTNTKALKAAPYTFPASACASGEILKSTGVNFTCQTDIGTGATPGDVMGPAAATLTNLASFDLATGKRIADSGISSGNVVTMTTAALAADKLISSAGANKSIKDSGILTANLVTMPTAAAAANTVLVTTGANKIAQGTTLLSTDIVTMTTNALAAGTVLTSAGLNKSAQDSGIVAANLVTTTANFSAANRVAIAAGGTRALTETGYEIPTAVCTNGFGLISNGTDFLCSATAVGDVVGPATSTDNAVARFDGATGKIVQNSIVTISDTNSMTIDASVPQLILKGTNTTLEETGQIIFKRADNGRGGGITWRNTADTANEAFFGLLYNAGNPPNKIGIGTSPNPATSSPTFDVEFANGNTRISGSLTINNTGTNSFVFPTGRGNLGQLLSTSNTASNTLAWQNPVVADLSRVTNEEVNSFNPPVLNNVNGWAGAGGAGADPLVLPAGVNGMYLSNTNWTSPVYLPAVNTTTGVAMYYQSDATNTTILKNTRTNMLGDFSLTTGNTATFVSNGSTWNFQGIMTNAQFAAIRRWPVYDSTGSFKASGQIASGASTITTNAVDWNSGNIISTNYNCAANITFANLKIGGTYTLIATDTGTTQCSFSTVTTGTDAATVTYRFRPANTTRVANTHTIYTLMRVGTTVYVSWGSNF